MLGTSPASLLELDDPSVLPAHAVVWQEGEQVFIGRIGGDVVLVRGAQRLRAGTMLQIAPGDIVELGRVRLAVEVGEAPQAAPGASDAMSADEAARALGRAVEDRLPVFRDVTTTGVTRYIERANRRAQRAQAAGSTLTPPPGIQALRAALLEGAGLAEVSAVQTVRLTPALMSAVGRMIRTTLDGLDAIEQAQGGTRRAQQAALPLELTDACLAEFADAMAPRCGDLAGEMRARQAAVRAECLALLQALAPQAVAQAAGVEPNGALSRSQAAAAWDAYGQQFAELRARLARDERLSRPA